MINKTLDDIFFQVKGKEQSKALMSKAPYILKEDLVITYWLSLTRDKFQRTSRLITNDMADNMGLSAKELHEMALINTPKIFPPNFQNLLDTMSSVKDFEAAFDPESRGQNSKIYVYENEREDPHVLTNNIAAGGAATLFYPDVQEALAQAYPEGYYVLPSSVHELMIISANVVSTLDDEQRLISIVQEVNQQSDVVPPKNKLSDSLYHIEGPNFEFKKARIMEKSIHKKYPSSRNRR